MNQKTQKIINNVMVLPLVERAEVVKEVTRLTQEEIIANSAIFGLASTISNVSYESTKEIIVEKEIIKEVRSQEDMDLIAKLQEEIKALKAIKVETKKEVKQEIEIEKEIVSDDIHILSTSSSNKDIMFGLWYKDDAVYKFCANKKVNEPVVFGNSHLNMDLSKKLIETGTIYGTDSHINVLVDDINGVEAGIYQLNNTKTLTGYYGEDYVFFISWDEKKGEYYTKPRVCRTKDLVECGECTNPSKSELARKAAVAMKELFINNVFNPSVDANYGKYTRDEVKTVMVEEAAEIKSFIGKGSKKRSLILKNASELFPGVVCEDELFALWYLERKDVQKETPSIEDLMNNVDLSEPIYEEI